MKGRPRLARLSGVALVQRVFSFGREENQSRRFEIFVMEVDDELLVGSTQRVTVARCGLERLGGRGVQGAKAVDNDVLIFEHSEFLENF
jgi:hypothetical protein